jgi:leucyl aminopeptidase
MTTSIRVAAETGGEVDVVARFVVAPLDAGSGLAPADLERHRRLGFEAKLASTSLAAGGAPIVVLVGLGERDRIDLEALRRAAAAAARTASHATVLAFDLDSVELGPLDPERVASSIVEGALLASYEFGRYKGAGPTGTLATIELVGTATDALTAGARRGELVAEAVRLARDLINTPAADATPGRIAEVAVEIAEREGLAITVLDEAQIVAERLGGLLGVARGSAEPPRLVRLEYVPADPAPGAPVALVGKGITFDSGGLSLKTGAGMMTMKTDMSGAAAVLATLSVCRRLGVTTGVVGFMPLTENMPGGRATKPGDVLHIRTATARRSRC